MSESEDVKVVRLYRFAGESKTRAFVDIAIGAYIIRGLRIVQGKKGLFLAMPQERSKDGKYFNIFYPADEGARQRLSSTVLGAYEA